MSQDIARQETGLSAEQRSPEQLLIARIRQEDFLDEVKAALPPTISPTQFVRATVTALLEKPELAVADQRSFFTALLKSAQMGLMPDGREAAINIYKTKVTQDGRETWVSKAQLLPMIHGQRKKLDEHGWTLRTAVVYANDEFDHAVIDGEERIMHRPVRPGVDRGELIAAYAIAKHRDGRQMQVVLHPDDIARRRAKAKTQKVWENDTAAMWEKSAGHDLFDQIGFGTLSERANRFLEEAITELKPGEAAARLYGGPAAVTPAALEASETDTVDAPSTSAAGETQQADGAATEQPLPAHTAPPATGDEELPGEPAPDEPSAFQAPVGVDDDPIIFAAKAASQVIVPIGAWKGLSLAEVHAAGDKGLKWLKYALTHFDAQTGTTPSAEPKLAPGELAHAVWAFSRVFAPDLFQAELARREAEAA